MNRWLLVSIFILCSLAVLANCAINPFHPHFRRIGRLSPDNAEEVYDDTMEDQVCDYSFVQIHDDLLPLTPFIHFLTMTTHPTVSVLWHRQTSFCQPDGVQIPRSRKGLNDNEEDRPTLRIILPFCGSHVKLIYSLVFEIFYKDLQRNSLNKWSKCEEAEENRDLV